MHAHAALFGVDGLLSLGLLLTMARFLTGDHPWKEGALSFSFWSMNVGLALMIGLSLLPIGLAQALASVEHGPWFARSADFLTQPWIPMLSWMRIVGDVIQPGLVRHGPAHGMSFAGSPRKVSGAAPAKPVATGA